ncbi:MAG TPA: hypothetical protein VHM90_11720 [Phycisphaerae bacterium]|nr:hypothetical protein [Phycisphaerae bacterium]
MNDIPEDLQERIAAYIDGEISPAEAARLEVYLANTDPKLADMVVGMLADKVAMRGLPRPAAPADLSTRVMESIERGSLMHNVEEIVAPSRPRWQSRAAIAAGLAILLGGFSYFVASSVLRPAGTKTQTAGGPNDSHPMIAMGPGAGAAADRGMKAEDAAKMKDVAPLAATAPMLPVGGMGPVAAKGSPEDKAFATASEQSAPPDVSKQSDVTKGPEIASAMPKEAAGQTRNETPAGGQANAAATPRAQTPGSLNQAGSGAPPSADLVARAGGRGGRGAAGAGFGGGGAGGAGGGGGGFGTAGGAAGGRGIRGGAGRGGAAAPADGTGVAPNSVAVNSAAMNQAVPTDDPERALAALARVSSGPLVVALQAKDDQDMSKLAVALSDFVTDNSRKKSDNDRAAAQNNTNTEQRQAQFGGGNLTTSSGTLAINGGAVAPQNGPAPQYGQNSVQFGGGNGGYVYNNGISTVTINNSGGVILNGNSVVGNTAGNSIQRNLYNDQQLANNDQLRNNFAEALQQAASRGGPYRAVLTQTQLEQLFKSYRVTLVARGEEAHVFRVSGDTAPAVADAREREQVLRRAGYENTQQHDESGQRAAAAPAAATTASSSASAPAAPQLAGQAKFQIDTPGDASYDCVIVIDPPAKVAPASLPAESPAK